jgi:Transglutaminase-like superfamily
MKSWYLWGRFARLPPARRALLAKAAMWLVAARAALALFPFRTIAARLGMLQSPEDASSLCCSPLSPAQRLEVQEIAWAVSRAARHVPFRAVCLPQAIAAKAMLRRRGIDSVLHFGVAKRADQSLDAHAWLDAAGIAVTGFPVGAEFMEVACFV